MFILKRPVILLLISFSMSSDAFGCEPVVEAWDGSGYQGDRYVFGKNCPRDETWNDKISSIKVHKDYVVRACEDGYLKGVCHFVVGNVPHLGRYRPTGINLNDRISSFHPQYQPRSEITIAGYYDVPDPSLGADSAEYINQSYDNFFYALAETDRIKRVLQNSGLNVHFSTKFHGVTFANAKSINEAGGEKALERFRDLYRHTKQDQHYGLYFPTKRIASGWDGRAYVAREDSESAHARFLKDNGFGIVNANVRADVGAHEWGHLAGLDHVAGKAIGIKPYGVGHFSDFFDQASFTTVMNGVYQHTGRKTIHLLFSTPKIDCKVPWFRIFDMNFRLNPACGRAHKSDARRALTETVLQWHGN